MPRHVDGAHQECGRAADADQHLARHQHRKAGGQRRHRRAQRHQRRGRQHGAAQPMQVDAHAHEQLQSAEGKVVGRREDAQLLRRQLQLGLQWRRHDGGDGAKGLAHQKAGGQQQQGGPGAGGAAGGCGHGQASGGRTAAQPASLNAFARAHRSPAGRARVACHRPAAWHDPAHASHPHPGRPPWRNRLECGRPHPGPPGHRAERRRPRPGAPAGACAGRARAAGADRQQRPGARAGDRAHRRRRHRRAAAHHHGTARALLRRLAGPALRRDRSQLARAGRALAPTRAGLGATGRRRRIVAAISRARGAGCASAGG